MPKLISSAIKFKPKGCDYFQIMCGKRHCNILEMMYNYRIDYERASAVQGFLTEDDQFVDRYDAYVMAVQSGQLLEAMPNSLNCKELYSEDIFPVEENDTI